MNLEYIIPNWPAPKNIHCISTTRKGGCSQKEFSSLNLGDHVKDNSKSIKNNRQLIKKDLSLPTEPVWLKQMHGSSVLSLDNNIPVNKEADAAYTNEVGLVCTVLTADCLPVVFCDQAGEHIAVAHAGWRGLVDGVLENTLQVMPIDNIKIMCWLGPAIGPNKFEVGEEVVEQFVAADEKHQYAFVEQGNGKYLANIYQLAKNILAKHNVEAIYGGEHCTYSESDTFYSYRRDGETGRIATLIWKK
ncbi:MAG: peptidoglycan editing factor PgeF [Gammaproteobacteria bacterium]